MDRFPNSFIHEIHIHVKYVLSFTMCKIFRVVDI